MPHLKNMVLQMKTMERNRLKLTACGYAYKDEQKHKDPEKKVKEE